MRPIRNAGAGFNGNITFPSSSSGGDKTRNLFARMTEELEEQLDIPSLTFAVIEHGGGPFLNTVASQQPSIHLDCDCPGIIIGFVNSLPRPAGCHSYLLLQLNGPEDNARGREGTDSVLLIRHTFRFSANRFLFHMSLALLAWPAFPSDISNRSLSFHWLTDPGALLCTQA